MLASDYGIKNLKRIFIGQIDGVDQRVRISHTKFSLTLKKCTDGDYSSQPHTFWVM